MDKEQIKAISESIPMEQRFSVEQIVNAAILKATKPLEDRLAAAQEEIRLLTERNATNEEYAANLVKALTQTQDQLAKAEQRVAEACALQVATEIKFHWLDAARVAKEIRSGEWCKFVKEV